MANRNGSLSVTFVLSAFGTFAAAFAQTPPAIAPAGSLYARLGGTPVVSAFVGDTIDKVAANPEMNRSFGKADLQNVKDTLTEQICALTGGGCAHRADTMDNAEFLGLVEAMRESMRARDVPLAARNQLLEILAPMNRGVVKL